MGALLRGLSGRAAAVSLAVLAMLAGTATYAWLAGFAPIAFNTRGWITGLLVADLVIAVALVALLAVRLTQLWLDRRRGAAGSRLHMRLVLVCCVFTITPTLIVAIILSLLVINLTDFVVKPAQASFEAARAIGEPVRRAREEEILRDIGAIAGPLQNLGVDGVRDPETSSLLERLIDGRPIIESTIIDADKGELAHAKAANAPITKSPLPTAQSLWRAVNQNGPVEVEAPNGAYFVMQLFVGEPLFLVTGHAVDLRVVDYIKSIEFAGSFYSQIEQAMQRSQLVIFVVCGAIALLMLLAAVWLAILFASRLTEPIGGLMLAAERVRGGDLTARVEEGPPNDELGQLARSFNRMASQIEQQRGELVDANKELDTRRRLTDAVLAGVSAGVLSVDTAGMITRTNRSALELLALPEDGVIGRSLIDVMPELAPLVEQAAERPGRVTQGQVEILQRGARRILLVRISAASDAGAVVTFDDVTDLMSAQRMAAWGDVARRIAHEIKNPLTPIQLSAERLKRRYLKQIKDDPETFSICTDTIIRQVGDIGRMVDEFSSFARMPRPKVMPEDAKELCQQALFLQRNGYPEIRYVSTLPDRPVPLVCDRRQVSQVLTNILKNSAEAIEGREAAPGQTLPPGEITLALRDDGTTVRIVVDDNGKGLPQEGRERLTEPYMTTRSKGTGLGLAIVKKIMEDHGGYLSLDDREGGGARISLVFRRDAKEIASVRSHATAAQ
jgi:two-component system nitrogen regulation sensor histidine kinase NtrY